MSTNKPEQDQNREQPAKIDRPAPRDQINEENKREKAHRERVQNVEPTQEYTPAKPPNRR